MLISFDTPISTKDLNSFLTDIESAMRDTGVVRSASAHHHVPVPGEEAIPAFIATAMLSFSVESRDNLAILFSAPGATDIIHKWKATHPYQVAWINHEVQE